MKLGEFRKLTEDLSDDEVLIIQVDSEGNGYSPLCGIYEGTYVADSGWSGEIYPSELTEADIAQGYTEEDLYDGDDGVNAIVLYPVN